MKIKEILSHYPNNFAAILVCEHCQHEQKLTAGYTENFIPSIKCCACGKDQHWTSSPCPEWVGPEDDDELIRRASRSPTFKGLWNADYGAICQAHSGDASSADAALASHLAFWTGRNCERVLRLMRRSALVRSKWVRVDYLNRTIQWACDNAQIVAIDSREDQL